jgi:hypothetical protein
MDSIPGPVEQFIKANIDSVDELEILRLLTENLPAPLSSTFLSTKLGLPISELEQHLTSLSSKGFIEITAEPLTCNLSSQPVEVVQQLRLLITTYQERPVSLIRMVYEKKKQLRLFSEAFRLKKED